VLPKVSGFSRSCFPGLRSFYRPAVFRVKKAGLSVNVASAKGLPMRVKDDSMGGEAGQFHTTRWTLVLASAQEQNQAGREALAALCQIYWYPLYAFARLRAECVALGEASRFEVLSAFVGVAEVRPRPPTSKWPSHSVSALAQPRL
jgi:hypothetical protein